MTAADGIGAKQTGLFGLALGRLPAELRTNRRAAAGLLAIGVLVAGYGLLVLDDAIAGLRATEKLELQQLQRITAVGQESDWPARGAAAAAMRGAYERRLWTAESEGGALADVQDWVTRTARALGIDKLQVRVEAAMPKALPTDLRRITATISAPQTEETLVNLLEHIASEPRLLVVERLRVQQQPVAMLEMSLVAYARVTGLANGKSEAPAP